MAVCLWKAACDLNCLAFHPRLNVLAAGGVGGAIDVLGFRDFGAGIARESSLAATHSGSVRVAKFSADGSEILSASSDATVAVTDLDSGGVKWVGRGHRCAKLNLRNPVNAAVHLADGLVASGDDEGEIRVWDPRAGARAVARINEFEDCVTDMLAAGSELLATRYARLTRSGDQIACFDAKKFKLRAMSDNTEHELLSMALVKAGKKLVCGTATGSLCFFSYGLWGDLNDIVPVNRDTVGGIVGAAHPQAKLSEDVVCTCGDDGEIHVVQLLPNKPLGGRASRAGRLSEFKAHFSAVRATDAVTANADGSLLAFVVNFDHVCLVGGDELRGLVASERPDFFDGI